MFSMLNKDFVVDGTNAKRSIKEIVKGTLEPLKSPVNLFRSSLILSHIHIFVPVKQLRGMKIDQVFIGSCTNGSYSDLVDVARILKGRTVHPDIEAAVSCASKQVMHMLASNGYLSDLLASGIRVLECVCGPCAGNGYSPNTGGISVRTNNRNFEGRCGTKDAGVYLVSPKTAAMSALCG